jgi:pyruvate carboxylase
MGSKAAAKALMERAGVPLVPGYHGANNEPAFLQAEAERIGFPVLIKASAGGGGRGMRRVDGPRTLLPRWPPANARPWPASGTTMCWSSATSPAAPHRDPGLRRHPGELRLPVRA